MVSQVLRALVVLLAAATPFDPAAAQMEWEGTQSESWFLGNNWNPVGPPGSNDAVIIDSMDPHSTVIALADADSAAVTVGNLDFGQLTIRSGRTLATGGSGLVGYHPDSSGFVIVTDAFSVWDLGINTLTVGLFGAGSLSIFNNGRVQAGFVGIGGQSGSQGGVTVAGGTSSLTHTANISVGGQGSGMLNINNGGQVASASFGFIGDAGVVTVGGANSAWNLAGGLRVHGSMTVEDQGVVTDDEAIVAPSAGSHGEVTVTGAGSQWHHSTSLVIGDQGHGVLVIEDGGAVANNYGATIAFEDAAQGLVSVTGTGSTWTSGFTTVGRAGAGSLVIEDGGMVSSAGGVVGFGFSSVGAVDVSGIGSSWNLDGSLIVGSQGDSSGALAITDGAAVTTTSWAIIGQSGSVPGQVTLAGAGSSWSIGEDLQIGRFGAGSLDIGAGAAVDVADTVRVPGETNGGGHGELVVNGELAAGGVVAVDLPGVLGGSGLIGADVTVNGVLAPGHAASNPVGTLTVFGSVELLPAATLDFELDGPGDPGDLLQVIDNLVLDGNLQITDLGGMVAGDYLLIEYGGVLTDNGLTVSGLPAGLAATLDTSTAGQVRLITVSLPDDVFADRFEQ